MDESEVKKLEKELRDIGNDFADKPIPDQSFVPTDKPGARHFRNTIEFNRNTKNSLKEIYHEYGHEVFEETPLGRIWQKYVEMAGDVQEKYNQEIKIIEQEREELKKYEVRLQTDWRPGHSMGMKPVTNTRSVLGSDSDAGDVDYKEKIQGIIEDIDRRAANMAKQKPILEGYHFLKSVNEGVAYLFTIYKMLKEDDLRIEALDNIVKTTSFYSQEAHTGETLPHYQGFKMVTHGISEIKGLFERLKDLYPNEKKLELPEDERERLTEVIGNRIRRIVYTNNMKDLRELLYLKGTEYAKRVTDEGDLPNYTPGYEEVGRVGPDYRFNAKKKAVSTTLVVVLTGLALFLLGQLAVPSSELTAYFVLQASQLAFGLVLALLALSSYKLFSLGIGRRNFARMKN